VSPVFSCGIRIVQPSCERIGKCRFFWGCGKLKTCGNPVKAHQVLLPAPNSRNPNLVPVGDGFGFLFVFDDLTV